MGPSGYILALACMCEAALSSHSEDSAEEAVAVRLLSSIV